VATLNSANLNNNVIVTNGGITKTGLGTMTLGAGNLDATANLYTGLTTVTAGTLTLSKAVGTNAVAGNILVNGGTLTTNRASQVADASNVTITSGAITLGGAETIASLAGGGTITLGSNTLTTGANSSNFSGGIAGAGSVVKSGAGTWELTGPNTYGGGTTVSQGILLANNTTDSATGTGAVTVTGGTLGGTGSIAGAVTVNNGGILSPGASIESLNVGAADIDGTLLVEYDTDATATIDLLAVTGNLDITNATVDFNNFDLESDALTGEPHIFATYGSLTGSMFASQLDVPAGYEIDYDYNTNSIALVAVPEPASLGLLGLAGLGLLRRRRAM
jgi:fibronectin-binding autotransporter adhesin